MRIMERISTTRIKKPEQEGGSVGVDRNEKEVGCIRRTRL